MSTTTAGLRFALVTTFYPPYHFGGDGQMVRRLAHALARRGNQVEVIHNADAYRMLSGCADPEPLREPDGVRVHQLVSRQGALSCLAMQQFGRPMLHGRKIRRILSQGFDVIHFHNISLLGGPGVLEYGEAIKLYTTHEHWLVCPSHILWRHNRELCTGRQCLRCMIRHRRPPQLWRSTRLLQSMCKHVDAFLAPSQFCADKHQEFGFEPEMRVLPNFLPDILPEDPVPAASDSPDRPFFLFVGRLESIKGLQDIIPLFGKDSLADLLVAGTGGYEGTLKGLATDYPSVKFLGLQTEDRLRGLYRRALAVVLPSICYEVFPMVILEAFREGTAVIARRLGPYPEIIEQSQGGLLFSNQEELKEQLLLLASRPGLSAKLGATGQQAFQLYWSETVVMSRYFEMIDSFQERPTAVGY